MWPEKDYGSRAGPTEDREEGNGGKATPSAPHLRRAKE